MAEVSEIRRKVDEEGRCRSCGVPDSIHGLDASHVIPKSLGGKNNYDSVVPLCRACHHAQHHDRDFEFLRLLTRDEQVEAVRAIGLARAYRYLTNDRRNDA